MKKIFSSALISLVFFGAVLAPISTVRAQNANPITGNSQSSPDYSERLQDCNPTTSDGFVACWVKVFYVMVLYPSGWFASVTAQLLDFSIAYSLDSNSYSQENGGFINQGWGIIRDIANVLFIFLLLFIAIKHVLSGPASGSKKMLISIIIAALLINFSLFFSKVVIDAGNILARAFYNNIEVINDDEQAGDGVKTISQALADKVSPQKILSSEIFSPASYPTPDVPLNKVPNGYAFFVMAAATFVNITIGLTFLSVFLLFVGRVVGLWFMMIFSPIAFASISMGGGGGFFGQFGFNSWRDNILKLSFMAPIFMFFLFLAIMFLTVLLGSNSALTANAEVTHRLAGVLIPFAVIVVIIRQAKKVAQDMAGEFGSALTGAVGKLTGTVVGFAGGAVIGGTAAVLRSTVGARMATIAGSEENKKRAANNFAYRQFFKFADKTSKKNFDLRDTGLGRRTTGLLNQGLAGASLGQADFGKGSTKGGYVQRVEAYQKEKEDFANSLKVSDTSTQQVQIREFNPENGKVEVKLNEKGEPATIDMSLQDAERVFLNKQNSAKKEKNNHNVPYEIEKEVEKEVDGVKVMVKEKVKESLELKDKDFEGLGKEKEDLEKKLTQANTDFAAIQRAAKRDEKGNIEKDDDYIAAENLVKDIKAKQKGLGDYIKRFEKEKWGAEKEMFESIEKQNLQQTANRMRDYSESVKNEGLTAVYELARLNSSVANDARSGASGSVALEAEKVGKKAESK